MMTTITTRTRGRLGIRVGSTPVVTAGRRTLRATLIALVAALAMMTSSSAANASVFWNRYSTTCDAQTSSTLYYSTGQADWLHVWAAPSGSYNIQMYNGWGQYLWGATYQNDRYFYVGNNVYRITIQRTAGSLTCFAG